MRWLIGSLGLIVVAACGGAHSSTPADGPDGPSAEAVPTEVPAGDSPAAAGTGEAGPSESPYGCKPTVTENVPPTTEGLCGPDICLPRLEVDETALCDDTKHEGCLHYLLARIEPGGTREPLNLYVRCPADPDKGTVEGKLESTLMKAYGDTGVPPLPPDAKLPAKACTHIALFDCR